MLAPEKKGLAPELFCFVCPCTCYLCPTSQGVENTQRYYEIYSVLYVLWPRLLKLCASIAVKFLDATRILIHSLLVSYVSKLNFLIWVLSLIYSLATVSCGVGIKSVAFPEVPRMPKTELSLCSVKHHAMQTCFIRGIAPRILNLGTRVQ
jgi:hypothetical protein